VAKPEEEELVTSEAILVPANEIGRIRRERIKDLSANKDNFKRAAKSLEDLGFNILAEGVVSITISGTRKLFEEVFQIKLNRVNQDKKTNTTTTNVESPKPPYYYLPDRKANVPKDLQDLVFNMVFDREPTFM
jgi:hypothetical protein